MTTTSPAFSSVVRAEFAPTTTYLNSASYGLLPKSVVAAVIEAEEQRMRGEFDIPGVDSIIDECRAAFGRLTGFGAEQVAVGSQVSQLVGLVAQSLRPGANVLVPEHEFNSVLWPFLVRTDLNVRVVPLAELPDAIRPGDDVVAAAVVQSADGAVLDVAATVAAARAHGARVLFDLSQAAGWLPVHDTGADWIVSVGYKWLLGPKGTAFLAGTPAALDDLTPVAAGWYAGYNPWETCYDGPLRLAPDARRFDVGPVWPAWIGQRRSLELIEQVGVETIHRHDVALADRLRKGLGLPEGNSAVVSIEVAEAALERVRAAGIVGAMRAGRLRLACHLYNTEDEIDRALDALLG
ncbi:aminotransferase class V-fold PLP-dependent enzyme [Nocardia sp. CDC160]|uniref:aminotransferase class V-fold PLP-dependent enzyme n=1 Tax=Nocardia sp. CDC160 TaxID=3112166 RepID=UPI002DBBF7B1|nr:aminotransferase class V-fold PLP-dependent enzyme [Nocardia sp. CDC160]MEC3920550.1 aminotransferase class V-fold PLP-dependent enzyme [Nocardia sp. CDC160]